ncbi:hypothetical protein [Echinicola soli]|nr:hypothetical protein [Echinicola soli]
MNSKDEMGLMADFNQYIRNSIKTWKMANKFKVLFLKYIGQE